MNIISRFRRLFSFILLLIIGIANAQTTKELATKVIKSTVSIKMINPFLGSYIQGSAFSVGKGRFVTNYHVIALGKEGFIQKSAKDSTKIHIKRIITFDVDHDLAVVEIDTINIPALEIAESSLEVGEKIYVCGNPLGLTGTFSDGIISANRTLEAKEVIQITAPVSSGSSGGPVVNEKGKVIGIVFSTIQQGQNLNFVIPSRYLLKLLSADNYSYVLPWYNKTFTGVKMKSLFKTKYDSKQDLSNLKLKLSKEKNAIYSITEESNRRYVYNYIAGFAFKPNFKITASLKPRKEGEVCLYWGNLMQPNRNSVYYGLQSIYYGLCVMNNSVWVEFVDKESAIVKQQPLALNVQSGSFREYEIAQRHDSLFFLVDSQVIHKEAYLRNPGKYIGIGGHGPLEIEIKNMEVFQDQDGKDTSADFKDIKRETLIPTQTSTSNINDETPIIGLNNRESFFTRYVYNKNGMESGIFSLKSFGEKADKNAFLSDGPRNYIFSVSPNSKTFYVERALSDEEFQQNHGLFVYNKLTGIKNDFPKVEGFYKISSYSVYHLSPDAHFLVASLYRFDSFGMEDIYVCKKKSDGSYGEPLNLGPIINTELDEGSMCMTPDNKYLFFSSNGHAGYGKKDLFMSKRLDSTWIRWTTPVNMGATINSVDNDENPTLNATTGEIYFKQTDEKGIPSFNKVKLPTNYINGYSIIEFKIAEPSKYVFVNIDIVDKDKGKMITSIQSEPTGFFWVFENGKKYKIIVKGGNKTLFEKEIDLKGQTSYQAKTIELK
jgi:hypothetical protein